jgi:hypothetical protein
MKRIIVQKSCILRKYLSVRRCISYIARGVIVGPTSKLSLSAMLVLPTAVNWELRFCVTPHRYNVHTESHPKSVQSFWGWIRPTEGQTDTTSPICVHFLHTVQRTDNIIICKLVCLFFTFMFFTDNATILKILYLYACTYACILFLIYLTTLTL